MLKKVIFTFILAVCLLYSLSTTAACFLSEKQNITSCESDSYETCCIVEYELDGQTCMEGWCYSHTQCEWEQVVVALCLDPQQSDP